MSEQCDNLVENRSLGSLWENNFCVLAAKKYGKSFTAHQIGRNKSASAFRYLNGTYHPLMLPDITLWSAPGEHHEIKHKKAAKNGCYGLEAYRLQALKWFADETRQSVLYTIHDWEILGRDSKVNREEDWLTADINTLWLATLDGTAKKSTTTSWRAGKAINNVPNWYWPKDLWCPLEVFWGDENCPF